MEENAVAQEAVQEQAAAQEPVKKLTLIEMLDSFESSSVYGAEADCAWRLVKECDSISKLMELNLENAEVLMRSLRIAIASPAAQSFARLTKAISDIPSVAVNVDFI